MNDPNVFNRQLSFYAPKNSSTLEQLESLLGLDLKFPARREIAECLLELLNYQFSTNQMNENIRKEYCDAIRNVLSPEFGDVPKGRGNTNKNPLKNNFSYYPIPALLLQPAKKQFEGQIFSIKSLLLTAIVLFGSKKYIDIVNQTRRTLSQFLLPVEIINLIPERITFSQLPTLLGALTKIQKSEKDLKDRQLAIGLSIVIEDIQRSSSLNKKLVDGIDTKTLPEDESEDADDDESETQDNEVENQSVIEKTKGWIKNRQRVTPNNNSIFLPNERRGLVDFLNLGMQSSHRNTQNASAIILLSYLTGQKIDSVLELHFGEKGALNVNGEYCRDLEMPEKAYIPKEYIKHLKPRAERIKLPLPPCVKQWLTSLPKINYRLVDCIETPQNELKRIVEQLLAQLKKTVGLNRVHQAKISAALQLELTLLYRDESLTHIIASRAHQAQATSSFYISHEVAFLQNAYALAITNLLTNTNLEEAYKISLTTYTFDSSDAVSGIYPDSELIASLPKNALAKLEACKKSNDIIDIHNAYVDYCIGLLMTGTGHRPVEDLFPKLSHIDLQSDFIIISDKAMSEKSAWRIAGIPDIAKKQIAYYLQHLKALSSKLFASGFTNTATQITNFLNGSEDLLPLFFYLNGDRNAQIESVTQERMNERWKMIWTLPPNFTRHILATELMKMTGSGDVVKIQLGHNYDSVDPFGRCSTISPVNFFREVSNCLDQILQKNHWHAIKSPTRATAPLPSLHLQKSGAAYDFGYKKRKRVRQNNHQNALMAIREVSINLFDKKELSKLSKADVTQLRLAIKQDTGPDRERRLKAFKLLVQNGSISQHKRNDKFGKGTNKIEPSPFQESSMREYLNAKKVRENWFSYLNAPRDNKRIKYELRLAEITVSAALSGGLHNTVLLEKLHKALPRVLLRIDNTVLIDFSGYADTTYLQRIWFPDTITTGLILGLSKITNGNFRRPTEKQYLSCLSMLLDKILPDNLINSDSAIECLVKLGQALAKFELPGFLRDFASGEYKSASLPISTMFRTERNMALDIHTNAVNDCHAGKSSPYPSIKTQDGQKGARVFKKLFSGIKKNIESVDEGASQARNERCKKKLYELIKSDFIDESSWRFDSKLIAGFAMHLHIEGTTRKENPAYNTLVDYINIVVGVFVKCSEDIEFYDKKPNKLNWASIYTEALKNTSSKQQAKTCTVLYQFHQFLTSKHGFEEIDWAPIYRAVGADLSDIAVNANFVSLEEYLLLIDKLLRNKSINEFKRDQIALIAMFGYRFGLRISEAHGALSRDIIYEDALTLIIRANYIRGLKGGARRSRVSLNDDWTDIENNLIQRYWPYSQNNFRLDKLSPFFLSADGGPREVVSKSEASKIIHALLKNITGDQSLSYHQFRHSKVTTSVNSKLAPLAYDFEVFDKTILNRHFYPLHEIAVGVGHLNDITTLSSYTHCLDKLILEWLPNFESHLTDRGNAYILALEYNSVRKKRTQNHSMPVLSTKANTHLVKSLPIPEITLKPLNDGDFAASNETNSTSLSIIKLANILLSYVGTTISIVAFLNSRSEPTTYVQCITESLAEFEQEFGYDLFEINKRLNTTGENNETNSPIILTATEKKGVIETLKRISKHKFVENRNDNGLANDLKILIKTFHPKSHSNLLNNRHEYYRLMMLLMNYFDSPPVVLCFASQNLTFQTETLSQAPVSVDFKKLPRAIEKVPFLQTKTAQLKIKPVRQRNIYLISIFIIGSYIRFKKKESAMQNKLDH